MNPARTIRIANTNDFWGSWSPRETSYGMLPGGEGLKRTVERLREEGPTIWVDAGDFAQGSAMAALSGGSSGFEAVSDLGIDVAAVGNHEFDWGTEHLLEHAPKTGFPLLCANADVGLPATAVISTEAGDVGFVGLTSPNADTESQFGPKPDPNLGRIVVEASERLRRDGALFVVALFHEGVDWSTAPSEGHVPNLNRFAALCRPWLRSVDAIVAGHTCGRFVGCLGDVPVSQPWAFGAEVGVIELTRGGESRAYGATAEPAGRWTGCGKELLGEAEASDIGQLNEPLYVSSNGPSPLLGFIARALREATGSDAAVVPASETSPRQSPVDGVWSFLPAGRVTEADLYTLIPYLDPPAVRFEVTPAELKSMVAAKSLAPWPPCGVDVDAHASSRRVLTVAMSHHAALEVDELLGRRVETQETGHGLRDAVREALREGIHVSSVTEGGKAQSLESVQRSVRR
jgi:2',3'-cyclic-nucleotide 2'-phosphodiesterase (5'-nucleotidase family)